MDFTLRKDATTQPPHYIVIFKAKDADNMEQAFKEFTAKKLQREERPSIRKDIAASKEKAAARNADRAKEKFKERGCHDEAGMKKLIIANLPYLLFVYLFGKLGQAYRLAEGIDLSQKLLHFADGCAAALPMPPPASTPLTC